MARFPRIPDLLTTANLACGVGSILLASQGQLTLACWLVFAGAFFDVLDGLAARALGGGTPLGAQLDSLADMVTFGVAPGMLVYFMPLTNPSSILVEGGSFYLSDIHIAAEQFEGGFAQRQQHHAFMWIVAILIPIFSAWRLAKFNLDTRQSAGFLGLPTPANALFWASIPLVILGHTHGMVDISRWVNSGIPTSGSLALICLTDPLFYLVVSVLLGGLMLSEIPLPSLKFKHFKWKGNEVMFLLLGVGVVLVVLYGILAVPLILLLYLLSPLWGKLFPKEPA